MSLLNTIIDDLPSILDWSSESTSFFKGLVNSSNTAGAAIGTYNKGQLFCARSIFCQKRCLPYSFLIFLREYWCRICRSIVWPSQFIHLWRYSVHYRFKLESHSEHCLLRDRPVYLWIRHGSFSEFGDFICSRMDTL